MCTVSFIPTGKEDFILTSNRDEQASRSPEQITRITTNDVQLIFPRDTSAGGTWIAISDTNKMVCLLNGGFKKHKHEPPYKRSRGIMVLEFFQYPTAQNFFDQYDFEGMEPFTMIIYDNNKLYELVWEESQTHIKALDPQKSYLWSSSSLYTKAVKAKRQQWFQNWLKKGKAFTKNNLLDFHKNTGDGDPFNDLIMNRLGIVQTVSITSIVKIEDKLFMEYHNLIKEEVKKEHLLICNSQDVNRSI